MKKYTVDIEFVRDVIGSNAADEKIKQSYIKTKMTTGRTGVSGDIATKKIDEEQRNNMTDEGLSKLMESSEDCSLTLFYRNEKGEPCIADHQLRDFVKEAFSFLNGQNKYLCKKAKDGVEGGAYGSDYAKRWISERINFLERFCSFTKKPEVATMERPIRMQTMQGPRVALKSSEYIKAGNGITVRMCTTDDVDIKIVKELFDRGMWHGLGQWSNAQFGSFKVNSFKEE